MTDDTQHLTAAAALRLAGDYPQLLTHAGSIKAQASGTIGRQSNVHGIPGGTAHHDLTREVRDTAFVYAEAAADARGLDDRALGDVEGNLRLIAVHADALDDADPAVRADTLPTGETVTRPACPVEHRRKVDGEWEEDTPEAHLRCLAHRVRVHLEPPGAREFVGPCPTEDPDTGTVCGADLRAYDGGVARCAAGHAADAATVRASNLAEASWQTHSLTDISALSLKLWGQEVKYETLKRLVRTGRLHPTHVPGDKAHYVRVSDVENALPRLVKRDAA